MGTKYKVEIEHAEGDTHTETEFQTTDFEELKRFLNLAGVAEDKFGYESEEYPEVEQPQDIEPYKTEVEEVGEEYFEPQTYDFTSDQPADYPETDYQEPEYDYYAGDEDDEMLMAGDDPEDKYGANIGMIDTEEGDSEAEYLQGVHDDLQSRYSAAKDAPAGSTVHCPQCNQEFEKHHKAKAFCCNPRTKPKGKNCKDKFWNRIRGLEQRLSECGLMEDDEDRDDASYDYGDEETRRQRGRISSGHAIDAYDYKGREEAEGTDQRLTNNYGNNAMAARMKESYWYNVDELGNVDIFETNMKRGLYVKGDEADTILNRIAESASDPKAVQNILGSYSDQLIPYENALQKKLSEHYKQNIKSTLKKRSS